MSQHLHRSKMRDIHEMICLNADRYKINRDDDTFVDLQRIKCVVTKYFGVNEADFVSERRLNILVTARIFYCGLAKNLTTFGLRVIGQGIGGRDHSTIHYNIHRLSDLFFLDSKLIQVYENMKAEILDKKIPYPDNYTYAPKKEVKLTTRQLNRLREKMFEQEEVIIDHSPNNNGYSHNHDKIYQ